MHARVVVAALVVAVSSGCASGGSSASPATTASRSSRSQNVISEAEIASRARDATNALQIIEQLRPQMLRSRGASSLAPNASSDDMLPRVYVDDVSYGTIGTLTNITALQIKEIQFVSSQNATTRWGTGHTGGVILVTTKK